MRSMVVGGYLVRDEFRLERQRSIRHPCATPSALSLEVPAPRDPKETASHRHSRPKDGVASLAYGSRLRMTVRS